MALDFPSPVTRHWKISQRTQNKRWQSPLGMHSTRHIDAFIKQHYHLANYNATIPPLSGRNIVNNCAEKQRIPNQQINNHLSNTKDRTSKDTYFFTGTNQEPVSPTRFCNTVYSSQAELDGNTRLLKLPNVQHSISRDRLFLLSPCAACPYTRTVSTLKSIAPRTTSPRGHNQ